MKIKQIALGILCMTASLLLSGCGSDFEIIQPPPMAVADNISPANYSTGLKVAPTPVYAEAPEQPVPGLYDPLYFGSTEYFSKFYILKENDYFTYDLMRTPNKDGLNTLTEPTNVSVRYYPDGYSGTCGKFSCFVYSIEEDYVYLGTAGHCIIKGKLDNCELMFYDRNIIKLSMNDYVLAHGFGNKNGDYAMYRIPTSVIPESTLLNLREVYYDVSYAKAVKSGDKVFSGNIYARNSKKDYDIELNVYAPTDAYVSGPASTWPWMSTDDYILTDGKLIPGQSGSAFFDVYGRLVGIASGHGTWDGTDYSILTRALKLQEVYDKLRDQ